MDRLILHVGPHKTGTTAIQSALHNNREQLLRSGVYTPVNEVEPGQHVPVLSKFYPKGEFAKAYPWGELEFDLDVIMRDMVDLGCETLLLSSEHFSIRRDAPAVTRLLAAISPRKLNVVVGMRPPIDYVISSFAQILKVYEVVGREPPQSFMGHYENRIASDWNEGFLASSIDLWRSNVSDSTLDALVFAAGTDVVDLFQQATGLPLPDRSNLRLNERLSVCSSRVNWDLQNFINRSFSSPSERRAVITQAVDEFLHEPVPQHDCDCAEPVAESDVTVINKAFRVYRDRLLASATSVWGDPASLDHESTRTPTVPRPPDNMSHDLVLKMLLKTLSKSGDIFSEMAQGNQFWQETSRNHEAAADFWRAQYEALKASSDGPPTGNTSRLG